MLVFADGKSAPAASRPPKSLVDKTSPTSQEVESDLVVMQGKGTETETQGTGAAAAPTQRDAGVSVDDFGPAVLKGLGELGLVLVSRGVVCLGANLLRLS